jgi:hypothetical protein
MMSRRLARRIRQLARERGISIADLAAAASAARRRPGEQAEVLDNPARDSLVVDKGDQPHRPLAPGQVMTSTPNTFFNSLAHVSRRSLTASSGPSSLASWIQIGAVRVKSVSTRRVPGKSVSTG